VSLSICGTGEAQKLNVRTFGVVPDSHNNATPGVLRAIEAAKSKRNPVLIFPKGRYDFWPQDASQRHYFISNHDAVENRAVAMPLEDVKNFVLDGGGSTFIFHGLILPISIVGGKTTTLRHFSVDYETPHILETTVVRVGDGSIDVKVPRDEKYAIEDNHIYAMADDWKQRVGTSQEFDTATKAIAWNTHANLEFQETTAAEMSPGVIRISGLPSAPALGNILILWNRDRPDPAIWVSESHAISIIDVNIHSAIGMGFLAQKSADIYLDGFRVLLSKERSRYITTSADAVHFSSCRGKLVVVNGLYENMLDDAINVHGTYLRVTEKVAADTVLLEWPHPQTFGFTFATRGERIQFVKPNTLLGYSESVVKSVSRPDDKHAQIVVDKPLSPQVLVGDAVDNVDWQPTVIYKNNTVRRNRSRGTIFKTPKGVVVEGNTFDHLSGTAVLLASDASSWFESSPSSNVVIRRNRFADQISTYGSVPILIRPTVVTSAEPDAYNVRNVRIEENEFDVFQKPLVVAISVDGLVFRDNRVRENHDYQPMVQRNAPVYSFNHTRCVDIGPNELPWNVTEADVSRQDSTLVRIVGLAGDATNTEWLSNCRPDRSEGKP
jgi:hypothetical protein